MRRGCHSLIAIGGGILMFLAEVNWNGLFQVEIISIIMGCLIPITWAIATAWKGIEKNKSDNALKRSLVERGVSIEEIERIVSAGHDKD
jgi:hypothetical protein